MKKSLVVALAAAFVFSVAGSAFAAANPFVDVPANHWAYAAVTNLAKAGLVDGMGDGTFQGNKEMTRYEMAQIVAKAMTKVDKADAANKALIEKLEAEFASELNNLGVRVSKLENKVGNIKFTGDARIRYGKNYDLSAYDNHTGSVKDRFQERVRLAMAADLSDSVAMNARLTAQNRIADDNAGVGSVNDKFEFDIADFTFKNVIQKTNFEVGRMPVFLGQGLLYDAAYFDGTRLTWNNKDVKIAAAYGDYQYAPGTNQKVGKVDATKGTAVLGYSDTEKTATYVDAAFKVTPDLQLTATYVKGHSNVNAKNWAVGYKYNITKDWAWTSEYTKNSYDFQNVKDNDKREAWFTTLNYKGANPKVAKSWGAYVTYQDLGANAADWAVTTLNFSPASDGLGIKGLDLGFNYVFAKNTKFTFNYGDFKAKEANASNVKPDYDKAYVAKMEFYF